MILFPDFMLCSTFICDGPCLCLSYLINFNDQEMSSISLTQMNIDLGDALIPINFLRLKLESSESERLLFPCCRNVYKPKVSPAFFPYHALGLSMCLGHSKSTSGHDLEYYYILYYSDSLVTLSNVNLGRTALE